MNKAITNDYQFRAILEHIADGVVVQDKHAQIVYINPAASRLLGFASQDNALAAGLKGILYAFDDIFDDDGQPLPVEMLPGRQAIQGLPDPVRIVRVHPRDAAPGVWRWAWVKATPVQSAASKPEFVVNIFQEITQLKQTELGLKSANDRMLKLLEHVLNASGY